MDLIVKFLLWLVRCLQRLSPSSAEHAPSRYEIERKFSISDAEYERLPARLKSLGFTRAGAGSMTDTFLPAEKEGDMMRIREEHLDGKTTILLTMKKWVEVAGERERKEEETTLDSVSRAALLSLGGRLAGSDLLSYTKRRNMFGGSRSGFEVTVALDFADGLGEYSGPYLEVEVLVEQSGDVASARKLVVALATEILEREPTDVAMSYMEMLKRSRSKK